MSGEVTSRVKGNWRTTIMGIPVFLIGLGLGIEKGLCAIGVVSECNFTLMEVITLLLIGYGLIMAKDSFLEGISLGLFKLKK